MLQEKPFHKVVICFLVVILVFMNTFSIFSSADGNFNPGDFSPGDFNPGDFNPGDFSPGDFNPGDFNPGDFSPGDFNPGDFNPGNFSPGDFTPGGTSPGNFNPGSFNPNDFSPNKIPQGNSNSESNKNTKESDKDIHTEDNHKVKEKAEQTEKNKFNFEQRFGHLIDDIIDKTTNVVKDGVDWTIEATADLANKTVDIFNDGTDMVLEGIDKISTGITETAEWIRFNGTKSFIDVSEFAETDFGGAIFGLSPIGMGFKWGVQSIDTDALSKSNDSFHNRINSFIDMKNVAFESLKKKNDHFFNTIKSHNNKMKNILNNINIIRDDLTKVFFKSQFAYLSSQFDFNPKARPYGTIKDITINDRDLMAFADLAYIENADQIYDTSKRRLTREDYIPNNFVPIEDLSTSGIAGFSGKTFVNNDDKKIVISFRGTEPKDDLRDFYADYTLVFGIPNPQHSEAKELTRKVLESFEGYEIVLVGHSLGGNIAQEVGRHYKIPTVTFNGPGIQIHQDALDSYPELIKGGLNPNENANYSRFINMHNEKDKYNDLIINHISAKDEIGKLGVHIGTTIIYDKDEAGKLIIYESDDFASDEIKEDSFFDKIPRTIQDFGEGTINHGIHNFEPYLQDGMLRRKEEE